MAEGYILEHHSRGVLIDQDFDLMGGDSSTNYRSRWSWSKPRTEAHRFPTYAAAVEAWNRTPARMRPMVEIRCWGGDWVAVPPPHPGSNTWRRA